VTTAQRASTRSEHRDKLIGWVLCLAGAGLLVATAGIHLDLYLTGYRSIPTIGWLFLVQVITGFALAAAILVTRNQLIAATGAGFALATLGGYLLSASIGLFGFKEVRTTAGVVAGIIEVATFATLGLAAIIPAPEPHAAGPSGAYGRLLVSARAGPRKTVPGVAAISALALVLLGAVLASTEAPPPAAAANGRTTTLRTTTISGVTVLTTSKGRTLYWFAPDTPSASKCTGSCAAYWPPVTGKPKAGPGVAGTLGTIRRADGTTQATYDGHPLYTYVGDSRPGQANGNKLNLNGGLWYEVRANPGPRSS
jgi:predicted lipoprotein with Yx(FWY)xxD motif